jgi:hypothetical protein
VRVVISIPLVRIGVGGGIGLGRIAEYAGGGLSVDQDETDEEGYEEDWGDD